MEPTEPPKADAPFVSVLIPARNEAGNIEAAVQRVVAPLLQPEAMAA